ncbi:hypothetical protein [Pseudomonas umsongensis]|nr:hypothetical protein [Pseudomonas umsongensis]SDT39320.1 hypothetical protein SAMN04490206_2951 [Pseudomonas umsongensis]
MSEVKYAEGRMGCTAASQLTKQCTNQGSSLLRQLQCADTWVAS